MTLFLFLSNRFLSFIKVTPVEKLSFYQSNIQGSISCCIFTTKPTC